MSASSVSADSAAGSAPQERFAAIAREVAQALTARLVLILRSERDGTATVVGTWGDQPHPFEVGSNWPESVLAERARGIGSVAWAPIVVDGEAWGVIGAGAPRADPPPDRVEERLADLTGLVAAAITSSEIRVQLDQLADEHAALRRVAMLVARGAPPAEVFDAVAAEVGRLLGVASTGLLRFEPDDTVTLVAGWGRFGGEVVVGTRLPLGGHNVASEIARTGRPARYDQDVRATGPLGEHARRLGVRAVAGGPIVVAGRLWGAMTVAAVEGGPLPPDVELRLVQFTELVATAVANSEARLEVARLADEQAALRRVATLVAQEAPVAELLAQAVEEVAAVLGPGIDAAILRYDPDDTATVVAAGGERRTDGARMDAKLSLEGSGVVARVYRERRPVRVDGATAEPASHSAVGCPILVHGRLWGAMVVAHHAQEPVRADTEQRVSQFAELVATGIANSQARAELRRLADEQTALRRVATLVAQGVPAEELLAAVAREIAVHAPIDGVHIYRYEADATAVLVAAWTTLPEKIPLGTRHVLGGHDIPTLVHRTGRAGRMDDMTQVTGTPAVLVRRLGLTSVVGYPIVVEGRLWGVVIAATAQDERIPADTEQRIAGFTELVATAIANADSRDQLTASRARVLTAGDEARRRLVRDLHDGAQQRQVQTIVTLKLAQRALRQDTARAESLVAEALEHAEHGNAELRELAHGILPAVLTRGGLRAGVGAVVSRLDLPVDVDIPSRRLPPDIEASAYFIAAEALTNAVKHAQASRAEVTAILDDDTLRLEVRDDGVGGADPEGHGLLGVGDRVAALGGQLRIESPPGGGTVVAAELPL